MNNEIKVSVIVPVYNLENYIDRCLNYIKNQTLEDIEIILIDDGSTDQSYKIIKEHASIDTRIKYVKQQNLGVSSARNKGIEMAKGSFVTFIDGDDYITCDMLENMCSFAENQKLDITFCLFANSEHYKSSDKAQKILSSEYIKKMLEGKVQRTACGVLFNSEFIKKNSLIYDVDMSYGEDMLFTIKALLLTEINVGIVPHEYYVVENRSGSAIRIMNPNQYMRIQMLAQRLDKVFEIANSKSYYDLLLQSYYYSDILLSVSHIIKSKIGFLNKLKKLSELKRSPHARYVLKIKFKSSNSIRLKAVIIKYFPSTIILFIYMLNNRLKKS
ncbi:glycosyltransferase family 2 protein [Paenibacillus foliorum]|nr:glycosyltransferase [Paenibacillus foliorum]